MLCKHKTVAYMLYETDLCAEDAQPIAARYPNLLPLRYQLQDVALPFLHRQDLWLTPHHPRSVVAAPRRRRQQCVVEDDHMTIGQTRKQTPMNVLGENGLWVDHNREKSVFFNLKQFYSERILTDGAVSEWKKYMKT